MGSSSKRSNGQRPGPRGHCSCPSATRHGDLIAACEPVPAPPTGLPPPLPVAGWQAGRARGATSSTARCSADPYKFARNTLFARFRAVKLDGKGRFPTMIGSRRLVPPQPQQSLRLTTESPAKGQEILTRKYRFLQWNERGLRGGAREA